MGKINPFIRKTNAHTSLFLLDKTARFPKICFHDLFFSPFIYTLMPLKERAIMGQHFLQGNDAARWLKTLL